MADRGEDWQADVTLRVQGYDPYPERKFTITSSVPVPVGRISTSLELKRPTPFASNAVFNGAVISRHHAEFQLGSFSGALKIKDLQSMHGTYLNSERLKPHQFVEVQSGDTIMLGKSFDGAAGTRILLPDGHRYSTRTFTVLIKNVRKIRQKPLAPLLKNIVHLASARPSSPQTPGSFTVPIDLSDSESDSDDKPEPAPPISRHSGHNSPPHDRGTDDTPSSAHEDHSSSDIDSGADSLNSDIGADSEDLGESDSEASVHDDSIFDDPVLEAAFLDSERDDMFQKQHELEAANDEFLEKLIYMDTSYEAADQEPGNAAPEQLPTIDNLSANSPAVSRPSPGYSPPSPNLGSIDYSPSSPKTAVNIIERDDTLHTTNAVEEGTTTQVIAEAVPQAHTGSREVYTTPYPISPPHEGLPSYHQAYQHGPAQDLPLCPSEIVHCHPLEWDNPERSEEPCYGPRSSMRAAPVSVCEPIFTTRLPSFLHTYRSTTPNFGRCESDIPTTAPEINPSSVPVRCMVGPTDAPKSTFATYQKRTDEGNGYASSSLSNCSAGSKRKIEYLLNPLPETAIKPSTVSTQDSAGQPATGKQNGSSDLRSILLNPENATPGHPELARPTRSVSFAPEPKINDAPLHAFASAPTDRDANSDDAGEQETRRPSKIVRLSLNPHIIPPRPASPIGPTTVDASSSTNDLVADESVVQAVPQRAVSAARSAARCASEDRKAVLRHVAKTAGTLMVGALIGGAGVIGALVSLPDSFF